MGAVGEPSTSTLVAETEAPKPPPPRSGRSPPLPILAGPPYAQWQVPPRELPMADSGSGRGRGPMIG